ncbi:MAG: hypothetical protein ACI4AQ_05885 [Lachnospiraceae bacterium]
MNVKKNPLYYVNVAVFLVLSIYSLLVCLNIFDVENINNNAGLCAVITSMIILIMLYVMQTTKIGHIMDSNPMVKWALEIISVIIFLTLACVIRVYSMGAFEFDIMKEGMVLGSMLLLYIVARSLNQYGFPTLLVLTPWPLIISKYNLSNAELTGILEVSVGMCVICVLLYLVRKKKKLRIVGYVLFVAAVVALLYYMMYQRGLHSVYVEKYTEYMALFGKMFVFKNTLESYYYIVCIMFAIVAGFRMWVGAGSANSLVMFAVNMLFYFTISYDLGNDYIYFLYPLLALVSAGAFGTRPGYLDEEIVLSDNLPDISLQKKAADVTYKDDSELDKMLEEVGKPLYGGEKHFNPAKNTDPVNTDDMPIELLMYDSVANLAEEEKKKAEALKKSEEEALKKAEEERLAREQEEAAKAEAAAKAMEEAQKAREEIERAKQEAEQIRLEAEAAAKAEAERVAAEAAQRAKAEAEAAAAQALAMAKAEAERLAAEKAALQAEKELLAAEKAAAAQAEIERLTAEKAAERERADRLAVEKLAAEEAVERAKTERLMAEAAAEKAKAERLAAESAAAVQEEVVVEPIVEEVVVEPVAEEVAEEPVVEEVVVEPVVEEIEEPVFETPEAEEVIEEVEEPVFEVAEVETIEEATFEMPKTPEEVAEEEEVDEPVLETPEVEEVVEEPVVEEIEEPIFEIPEAEEAIEEVEEPVFEVAEVETVEEAEFEMPKTPEEVAEEEEVDEPVLETPEIEEFDEALLEEPEIEEFDETLLEAPEIEEFDEALLEMPKTSEAVVEEPAFETPEAEEPFFEVAEVGEPVFEMPEVAESIIEEPVIEEVVPVEILEDGIEQMVDMPSFESSIPVFEEPVKEEEPPVEEPVVEVSRAATPEEQDEEYEKFPSFDNEGYGFTQSKPMFETMASFLSKDDGAAFPKFETLESKFSFNNSTPSYSTIMGTNTADEAKAETIEATVETPKDSTPSIFEILDNQDSAFDAGFVAPEFDINQLLDAGQSEANFGEESDNSIIMEPESFELGFDAGEEFDFGQTQTLSDFYDMEAAPTLFDSLEPVAEEPAFEENVVEEPEVTEGEVVAEESIFDMDQVQMDIPETLTEDILMEESVAEPVEMMEDLETPEPIAEESVAQETFVEETPAEETFVEETVVEPLEESKPAEAMVAAEPVKKEEPAAPVKVNPYAKEADFFDWSSIDESEYVDNTETQPTEDKPVVNQAASDDDFAEFVWTDEMVKGLEATAPVQEEVEEVKPSGSFEEEFNYDAYEEVKDEIATTAESAEPVIPTVADQGYNMGEDTSDFEVYQPSGSIEIPEEIVEEEEPQYEVFQSSGNFTVEETVEVEEPQYEVFQSSGNFTVEEVETVEPSYTTYGGPEEVKQETVKPATGGTRLDDFEFDLDLPDFEPIKKN